MKLIPGERYNDYQGNTKKKKKKTTWKFLNINGHDRVMMQTGETLSEGRLILTIKVSTTHLRNNLVSH